MTDLLDSLIQLNFFPIVAALFLGYFLLVNKKYESQLTLFFLPMLIFLIILIIADNLDYVMFDYKIVTISHKIVALIGYNMRLLILLRLVTIMDFSVTGQRHRYLAFPVMSYFIITGIALVSDLVISYDSHDGHIIHGPLGYSSHAILAFYLLYGVHLAYFAWKKGTYSETGLILLEEVLCVIATIFETNTRTRGILVGVVALNIIFYYLYQHMVTFYKDPLTGVLNRASFYAALHTYENRISAIYSIDLNGLKTTNDALGHDAGDKLLIDAAVAISKALVKNSYLYRTGGDEFVILCVSMGRHQIEKLTDNLFKCREGGCDMAFGMQEFTGNAQETFRLADDAMYRNKRNIKMNKKKSPGQLPCT